jgi:hypothetical protein
MARKPASESRALDSSVKAARWLRTVAIALSIVFALFAIKTCAVIFSSHNPVDFLSFWAAGHLAASGRADSAYDVVNHRLIEMTVAPITGILPFPYPPPFLLLVAPFGLMPYWAGFAAWIVVTYAGFVISSALIGNRKTLPFALSHPAVMANFMIGQNGFLTSSIFMFGAKLLDRAPFFGGAIFGLLIIKPQLALVLPFAFIAGREWKAIIGGIVSSVGALTIAWAVFGGGVYKGFFETLPIYTQAMGANKWPWNELASPFASLRFLGVPEPAAVAIHAAIAFIALALACRAWWLKLNQRFAILACATLLVPPYLFTYDSLLLVLPLLTLANVRRPVWIVPAIWMLCLLPVATYFGLYPGPNTIPVATILCMWMLHKDRARLLPAAISNRPLPALERRLPPRKIARASSHHVSEWQLFRARCAY